MRAADIPLEGLETIILNRLDMSYTDHASFSNVERPGVVPRL